MTLYSLPEDERNGLHPANTLEKQLALLNSVTRNEFDQAERLVLTKLQAAMDSLRQSATAIRMLIAAQSPGDLASPAGAALRSDLEALLASSTHLSRLATMMQDGFTSERKACEKRTDQEIANVIDAVEKHRNAVQNNAIALTEAALDKARAPSSSNQAGRAIERRSR